MAAPVPPLKDEAPVPVSDDETHEQEAGKVSPIGQETSSLRPSTSPKPRVSFQDGHEEIPPQKPPRPVDPRAQAEHTLIEAFPSVDVKVIKAVLSASHGQVEPAFNALLGMTDPDFKPEEAAPPPQPPRPAQRQPRNQMEADEMYARRLADQYNSSGQHMYNQREPGRRGPNRQYEGEQERSFFDDDLPEIGRNIQKGFAETQKTFNSWITNFKKKIDGEDEEEDLYSGSASRPQGRQNFGGSQNEQMYGIRKSAESQRRSTDAQRYDADPHELDYDEFDRLELRDEEVPPPQPPRTSSRKAPNPDLFKSQPKPPQSGPVDEVDAAERKGEDSEKGRKWQPLTSVAPHPEDDNDPFSLGDDDEETKDKSEDTRKEDSDRLKQAAGNSVSGESGKVMSEHERTSSGTKNKEAEELLTGKK
ncbi:Hypothetical protein R9X50_00193600 [Acrodontium crateriforme]|uniref:CUE domain-containing protein n=1 Tax=Acrodontium crateriforme TaxID=150365 RepID=A0AAQ3M3B0_9PEZI|nr:Hypothetical protein R9X50_00193600 [Acrodontium crateriforme]